MDPVRERITEIQQRADAATIGPWFYDSYSAISSGPMVQVYEDFWSDERCNDGHTYTCKPGTTCPECGERAAIHGEEALPEFRGKRFGTYWGCALTPKAEDADCHVARVPPSHGDTASGIRIKNAEFIAAARADVPALLAALTAVLDVCRRFEDRAVKDAERRGFADPAAYAVGNTLITTSLVCLEIRSALLGATP